MKHFKNIKSTKERTYKMQNESMQCAQCGTKINETNDFFQLNLFWKIKKKPDMKNFCSLSCVEKWCQD